MGDKPQKNPGIRLRRAASDWTHNRTTGTIRNDFRRNFLTRLKGNRSRSVDRFRLLVDNYGELISYRSVSDLRAVLAEDPEASRLMNDTEVTEVLNEIERELAHVDLEDQGENHISETERETHDILQRHLYVCNLCKNPTPDGAICKTCTDALEQEFKN
ncbi:uncharacterized protein LOC130900731 isoform X1 [Diorhabda carinulata]|uniref:uncharacterized protein LOC130900731 isoform X1 n=1 Tax=Diorhabda carinulata TaxID=1163345 RepID=UPI0025A09AB8|nr:uncharacterized protein LOC130900731 isoform X1 [Diorhabda carinulata]